MANLISYEIVPDAITGLSIVHGLMRVLEYPNTLGREAWFNILVPEELLEKEREFDLGVYVRKIVESITIEDVKKWEKERRGRPDSGNGSHPT